MALGPSQSLVKMSTRSIPGGKGGRCVRLTTLPPSCAEFHEIWEPKPPGTLWVTPGLLRDCFTFTFNYVFGMIYFMPFVHSKRHIQSSEVYHIIRTIVAVLHAYYIPCQFFLLNLNILRKLYEIAGFVILYYPQHSPLKVEDHTRP